MDYRQQINLKMSFLFFGISPEREYQKAALDILEKTKKKLGPDDMPWLGNLILNKSWWDTVDVLSPHVMGYMFSTYPKLIPQYSEQWIENENIWLQRAAGDFISTLL